MVVMPEIVDTAAIAKYLGKDPATIRNIAALKMFVPGIYIGRGTYNMDALKQAITQPPYRYTLQEKPVDYRFDLKEVKARRKK